MKRRPIRASVSRVQEARRWAWLKNKMEQLAERLPQRPPQQPFFPPQGPSRDQEPFRRPANPGPPRSRGGGFDDLGWGAPFGPPSPSEGGGPPRRSEERGTREERETRPDGWWDGPLMDWGRPPERESPPWQPPRDRNGDRDMASWGQPPRNRDGARGGEIPSWGHVPRNRDREAGIPSWDRSPGYRDESRDVSPDRYRDEGRRWGENREEHPRNRTPRREWEDLPSLFDETETVNSSGLRRRRKRGGRRRR